MLSTFLLLLSIAVLFMSGVFVVSLILKNNGIVDVAWGIGIMLITLITFFGWEDDSLRKGVGTALVLAWGARLSIRIFLKNMRRPEDFRYRAWREKWGSSFVARSFFQIYLLQGFLLTVVALPILLINTQVGPAFAVIDYLGVLVWCAGFFFESVGDFELDRFLASPKNKGKIFTDGLWKYSRHPNYFGETLMWFGIGILALSVPNGFWGLLSPLLILFLLLAVSGIPMLERRWSGNLEFEAYKRKTSAFIPRRPKEV